MPNLASPREQTRVPDSKLGGSPSLVTAPELSVVLNEFNNVGMKVEEPFIKFVIVDLVTALATFLVLPRMLVKLYRKKNKSEVVTQSVKDAIPGSGMSKSASRLGVITGTTCPVARQRPQGPEQGKQKKQPAFGNAGAPGPERT